MDIKKIKRIIHKWPAYEKYIENQGIVPSKIKNLDELPVVDKDFISTAIHMLPVFKVRNIIPSSGSTGGEFSYGLFGDTELKKTSHAIARVLKDQFNVDHRKTLLLNMLPGALHIQSSSVSTASIGVRIDTAISVIKSFSSSFDQLILIGEPLFMKHLIETGVEESIPWKHIPLYIVVGGEWIPEGYREYIEIMTGSQRVYSNMGMAELGLNYFVENDMTILLRHILLNNKSLRNELFGDIDFCPMIFTYNENDLVVESLDDHYIVLTTTDLDRALPLIRYKSGDKGRVLSNREVIHALTSNGYSQVNMSGLMPILAHYGRGRGISHIYPETVKEIIFNNWDLASTTTANFQLCRRNSAIQLDIQLKQGVLPNSSIVNKYIKAFEHMPVHVKLYSHEGFPNKLDFERKVQYVSSSSNGNGRRREKACLPTAI